MKGVVVSKPSRPPKGNESKNSTDKNKGQALKSNNYRGKKTRNISQGPEPKAETNFKGRCSDLEGYISEIGPRASEKFARTMKDLERYLGATYRNICQQAIMTKIPETFPDPEIPTIIPDTGAKRPKMDVEMTFLKENY